MNPQFTASEVVTAAKMNQLPKGVLGRAQVTASQTGITTLVDLTSLSVSVTVVTGRVIRVSFMGRLQIDASVTNLHQAQAYIREGSTTLGNAGTQRIEGITSGGARGIDVYGAVLLTPTAGSHTYKISVERAAGTVATVGNAASATNPSFILVEDIGGTA